MPSRNKSSVSSSGGTSAGKTGSPLDVADVPDAISEAMQLAREMQQKSKELRPPATADEYREIGERIEKLLRPALAAIAAAAEQLAEVA